MYIFMRDFYYAVIEYVTFNVSPLETIFDPPEKLAADHKIPPAAVVSPTVATAAALAVAVTTIFPIIVAVPIIGKLVVVADFAPADAAVHPISNLLAIIALVTSVTVGEEYVLVEIAVPFVIRDIYQNAV